MEIQELETKKTIENNNETKTCYFERLKKKQTQTVNERLDFGW